MRKWLRLLLIRCWSKATFYLLQYLALIFTFGPLSVSCGRTTWTLPWYFLFVLTCWTDFLPTSLQVKTRRLHLSELTFHLWYAQEIPTGCPDTLTGFPWFEIGRFSLWSGWFFASVWELAAPGAADLGRMMEEVSVMMAYDAQYMEKMSEEEIFACLADDTGPQITVRFTVMSIKTTSTAKSQWKQVVLKQRVMIIVLVYVIKFDAFSQKATVNLL